MSDIMRLTDGSGFDRVPPHSIEAEMCLLASMMLDKELVGQVVSMIGGEAFYLADHQIVYDLMLGMYQQNRPIDAVILREELSKRHQLEEIGGTAYLAQVLGTVPSAAHGQHYAGIVREKFLLRQLISASNESLRDAYAPHDNAELIIDRAEKRVFEIANKKIGGTTTHLGEIAMEVYEMLEGTGRRGLMTKFAELDDMLNGLQEGELIIVAARPSMGKTAIAMNIVENIAAQNIPCAVFSLEMSKQQLAQRMMCSRAQIDSQRVRKGLLQSHEYQRLAMMVNEMNKLPIWVDDSPGLTVLELRGKVRRLCQQNDQIRMVMIDYMQLMDNPGPESRQQQISEISRGIKAVAREMKLPVVCLSQLNRASEGRDGHRPRMSDLRESGSIEQDADVVALLHREDYYRQSEPDFVPDNIAELIIAKQRNGPTGTVKLTFDNRTTTFKNLASNIDAF